jgi:hypothetical protein
VRVWLSRLLLEFHQLLFTKLCLGLLQNFLDVIVLAVVHVSFAVGRRRRHSSVGVDLMYDVFVFVSVFVTVSMVVSGMPSGQREHTH